MIDWWNVFTNILWILGLAWSVAVFSYADWVASRRREGLREAIGRTWQEPLFLLGLAIACLGAGLGVSTWWHHLIWFILAAGFLFGASYVYAGRRKEPAA